MTRPRVVHRAGDLYIVGSKPGDLELLRAAHRRAQRQELAVWLLLAFLALAAVVAGGVRMHRAQADAVLGKVEP